MRLLFNCTHNHCRSILGEMITNHLAKNRRTAHSAGSQPTGQVHWGLPDPSTLEGSVEEIQAAFFDVIDTIEARIHALMNRDFETHSGCVLQLAIQRLTKEV